MRVAKGTWGPAPSKQLVPIILRGHPFVNTMLYEHGKLLQTASKHTALSPVLMDCLGFRVAACVKDNGPRLLLVFYLIFFV